MKRMSLLILLFAVPAVLAQAYQPVVAKTKRIEYKLGANGAKTLMDVWQGVYLRAADGTTLRKDHVVRNGKAGPDRGELSEPDGQVTKLDWVSRKATVVRPANPAPEPQPQPFSKAAGAHRIINGVDCVVVPVVSTICEGHNCHPAPPDQSWGCGSQQYGTIVYLVQIRQTQAGQVQTIQETYDFRPVAPDPDAMRVPEGFAVSQAIPVLQVPHR